MVCSVVPINQMGCFDILQSFYILAKIPTMRFLYVLLIICFKTFAQGTLSENYFRLPLDIPMQLSGNFAELRPNHFHAGFDFKTNQREGLPVYAAADGYVSRIKISNNGYGKAIYITHANGYTTVYGHLQKATGVIEEKIIDNQYAAKSYEIESFFKPDELTVKKGDIIAISGNTGGSEGPHLHFEIRDNKTEKTINPLLFGFELKDTKSPQISSVMVYPIDGEAVVNESKRPIALNLSLQADGTYLSDRVMASGNIGFGVISSDFDDVSFNNNGIYKAALISNGYPIFGYQFDKLVFDEARYVNAFIDFSRYKKTYQRVQKLFMKNFFPWSNVTAAVNNGIIHVVPNFVQLLQLYVADFNGNKVTVFIPVSYSNTPAIIVNDVKTTPYYIQAKNESIFEKENWSVSFAANTFYDDFYLQLSYQNAIFEVHNDLVPVHTNFTVAVADPVLDPKYKNKYFIASINNGKLSYNYTFLQGTTLSCKTKNLGEFTLAKDTIAPKISMIKSIQNKDISNQKQLKLTVSDELSGIKTINGYLNDNWILLEYESKLKRLTYEFKEQHIFNGNNNLKVIVTDNVGNSATFETQFIKNQLK